MDHTCAECGYTETIDWEAIDAARAQAPQMPEEPPVGTWVRDRHGAVSVRIAEGWAPAPTGFYGTGRWADMWQARGPLVPCTPGGHEE